MADITLKDGTEVNFDLSKITLKQWRELKNPIFSGEDDDTVLAPVCGLDSDKLASLPFDEYKRLFTALVRKMTNPLADPN